MSTPIHAAGVSPATGAGMVKELELQHTTRADAASFSRSAQGLWGSVSLPDDLQLTLLSKNKASWNSPEMEYSPGETYTHYITGIVKDAAESMGLDVNCDVGASLAADCSGWLQIGTELDELTGGTADLDYSVDRTMSYPAANTFWHGDTVSIESSWEPGTCRLALAPLSFEPSLVFEMDVAAQLTGEIDYGAGSESLSCDIGIGDLGVPTTTRITPDDVEWMEQIAEVPELAEQLEEILGIKSFVLHNPSPVAVAATAADDTGALNVRAEDTFAAIDVDVDTLAMFIKDMYDIKKELKKEKPDYGDIGETLGGLGGGLSFEQSGDFYSVEVTAANMETSISLTAAQDLGFEPTVRVRYDFDREVIVDGSPSRSATTDGSGVLDVTFPAGLEDTVTVTPTLLLEGDLEQGYSILGAHDTEVLAGEFGLEIEDTTVWGSTTCAGYLVPAYADCDCSAPCTGHTRKKSTILGDVWYWVPPYTDCDCSAPCVGHVRNIDIPAFKIPGMDWDEGPLWGPKHLGRFSDVNVLTGTDLSSALRTSTHLSFSKTLEPFVLDPQTKPYAVPLAPETAPYEVDEGSIITLDGSASYDLDGDPIRYYWDLDNDGEFETEGAMVPFADATGKTRAIEGPAVHTVTLMANDPYGYRTAPTEIKVLNVAPTVAAPHDVKGDEGSVIEFSAAFTDPGTGDSHTATIDWGDGTTRPMRVDETAGDGTATASHAYGDNGVYDVTVTVTDDDGGVGTDTVQIEITNVAPATTVEAVRQPNPFFILPNVHELTFTGSFSDPGWLDTHTALWDFGDGITSIGTLAEENNEPDSTGTMQATHTYSRPGIHAVQLAVSDDDNGTGTDEVAVKVQTPSEALGILRDYVLALPDACFAKPAQNRRTVLADKIQVVDMQVRLGAYDGAINKLLFDIRPKAEGVENSVWVYDPDAQRDMCLMIDDIVACLEALQNGESQQASEK